MKNIRPAKIKFTKEGYEKIQTDFQKYTLRRKEVIISLRTAREMGDLSENGAYKAAKFELGSVDRELRRLTFLLRFGEVTEVIKGSSINFGSTVTLDNSGKQMTFTLVGSYESNPQQQKLSVSSPIGRAIIGKKIGDKITITAPAGQTIYTVVNFE